MNDQIRLQRSSKKIEEIEIDRSLLIEPFNPDYKPPFLKAHLFLELLSKTDDSFTWIESQAKDTNTNFEVDEDGVIIPDQKKLEEYESKMKPIRDCEEFIIENSFSFWDLISLMEIASKHAISASAREKAYKRLANDPKQKALAEIEQHYEANKSQFKRYGYSAQFIREMHANYPIIESQKTIENLVSALNKENDAIPR
jgi:hypothetical protein